MNKFILAIIAIAVLAAAGMAGLFSLSLNKNQEFKPVSATASCVDFDPPDTTDTVSYGGFTYGLIKKGISISQSKMGEMTKVDAVNNLYIMASSNWYGQKVVDVVYKAIAKPVTAAVGNTDSWFDVYFKSGTALPDYIKNCKASGGTITVIEDTTMFPPYGFNKTEISGAGASDPSVAVAYIYDGNSGPVSTVLPLQGVTQAGTLFVKSKNKSYQLLLHLGTIYLIDGQTAYEYMGTNTPIFPASTGAKSLQLKKIQFVTTSNASWWTPSCKPAIYLYPTKEETVNVKVNTKGKFTLTIPSYEANGWTVTAQPNGTIKTQTGNYPYLYYESVVPDLLVQKPGTGYVAKKSELPELFETILPKLGLNSTEAKEFKNYWQKALPDSNYYFVGVMTKEQIDAIEPLEFTPKPDTLIRVRLYFEALKEKIAVKDPVIITPKRNGFTAVEWGGMVKTDKENPFTCSQ